MSMKRKNVGHEQGLSVQLSIIGHFFPRRPPKRNCLGTPLNEISDILARFRKISNRYSQISA